jgi:DNA-binding beta-propeller fold protein YncE
MTPARVICLAITSTRWALAALAVAGGAACCPPYCPPPTPPPVPIGRGSPFGPPTLVTEAFLSPAGVGVDTATGRVLVADTGNQRIKSAVIEQLVGTPACSEAGFVADRKAPGALNEPQGVAGDASGVYVANTFAGEVQRFRWNGAAYAIDPAFAAAAGRAAAGRAIRLPPDVAVAAGKVYLLDSGNHRVLVTDAAQPAPWSVLVDDASWDDPYGLDVGADGTVYVADTQHDRIVQWAAGKPVKTVGAYGTAPGFFRGPRDVAVGPGGKLFVADTGNHRIAVLKPDGAWAGQIGVGALLAPAKIASDAAGRLFVVDADAGRFVAWLGPTATMPFDVYVRDNPGDDGREPSDTPPFSCPDLLVRRHPDVDVAKAVAAGLESFAFEQPRVGEDSFVYLAVRNRGLHPAPVTVVRLYWADPGSALAFPTDWKPDGFDASNARPPPLASGNSVGIDLVPPRTTADGVVVVGPVTWRPPAPATLSAKDGKVDLLVRLLNVDDPSVLGAGLQEVAINNNIALRTVQMCSPGVCSAGSSCGQIPDGCGATLDCGACPAGGVCGAVKPNVCCTPNCAADNACGPDGCGGSCGSCDPGMKCQGGVCYDPTCGGCDPRQRCIRGVCR